MFPRIFNNLYFLKSFRKTKIVSSLTLEYVLKGSIWSLVGRTRFFEWLAARSRVFEGMVSILHLIIFWIFSRLTNIGRLGAYHCVKQQPPCSWTKKINCVPHTVLGLIHIPLLGRPHPTDQSSPREPKIFGGHKEQNLHCIHILRRMPTKIGRLCYIKMVDSPIKYTYRFCSSRYGSRTFFVCTSGGTNWAYPHISFSMIRLSSKNLSPKGIELRTFLIVPLDKTNSSILQL